LGALGPGPAGPLDKTALVVCECAAYAGTSLQQDTPCDSSDQQRHRHQQTSHHHQQQQQQTEQLEGKMTASLDCDAVNDDDDGGDGGGVSDVLNVDCECVKTIASSPSVLQPVETHTDTHAQTHTDTDTKTVAVSGCYEQRALNNEVNTAVHRRPASLSLHTQHTAHTDTPLSLHTQHTVHTDTPLSLHTQHTAHSDRHTRHTSSSSSSAAAAAAATVNNGSTFTTPVESPSLLLSTSVDMSTPTYAKMRHFAQSPVSKSRNITVPCTHDAYMSPLLATDDLLAQMCPVYCVVSRHHGCCHGEGGRGGKDGHGTLILIQGTISDFGSKLKKISEIRQRIMLQ